MIKNLEKALIRYSEILNISSKEFEKRGILNPSVNGDTPLFIDPRLLKKSNIELFNKEAFITYENHYKKVALFVKKILKTDDKIVKEKMKKNLIKFLQAKELDGLCLGYAHGNPGIGLGKKYATAIMNNAIELYDNYEDGDETVFSLLHLLTEGIGADYIGDITSQIIKEQIYKYTEQQANDLNIPTEKFDNLIEDKTYNLPVHPQPFNKRIPIVFVPRNILSALPVDADMEDIFKGYLSDNDIIRDDVNHQINTILKSNEKKKNKQKMIFEFLKNNKDVTNVLTDFIKKFEPKPYDFIKDTAGYFLRDKLLEVINFDNIKPKSESDFVDVIATAINEYKKFIDKDNDTKRMLLWKPDGKNQPESYWQKVFQIYIQLYLEKSNIDISAEVPTGAGLIDFKMSRGANERILVELKLSKNLKFKQGLTKQLETYKKCFNNVKRSYFIYIDIDKNPSISNQKRYKLMQAKNALNLNTEIIFINGIYTVSASKL